MPQYCTSIKHIILYLFYIAKQILLIRNNGVLLFHGNPRTLSQVDINLPPLLKMINVNFTPK